MCTNALQCPIFDEVMRDSVQNQSFEWNADQIVDIFSVMKSRSDSISAATLALQEKLVRSLNIQVWSETPHFLLITYHYAVLNRAIVAVSSLNFFWSLVSTSLPNWHLHVHTSHSLAANSPPILYNWLGK